MSDNEGADWLRILAQMVDAIPGLYNEFRPEPGDPAGKALGKSAVRYGSAMAVGGLGMALGGMTAVRCYEPTPPVSRGSMQGRIEPTQS